MCSLNLMRLSFGYHLDRTGSGEPRCIAIFACSHECIRRASLHRQPSKSGEVEFRTSVPGGPKYNTLLVQNILEKTNNEKKTSILYFYLISQNVLSRTACVAHGLEAPLEPIFSTCCLFIMLLHSGVRCSKHDAFQRSPPCEARIFLTARSGAACRYACGKSSIKHRCR